MHDLMLLQLAFNILILTALLMLGRPRSRRKAAGESSRKFQFKFWNRARRIVAKPQAVPAPAKKVSPDTGLGKLIERAEKKELVAEQALRARLGRFSARAAG